MRNKMLNVLGDATPFERRNRNKGEASFHVKLEKFWTDAFIVLLPRSETFSKSRDAGYRRIYFHSFRCPPKCYVAKIVGLISNRCFELFLRNGRTKEEHRERWRADRRRNDYEDLRYACKIRWPPSYRITVHNLQPWSTFATSSLLVPP